jgi:hypothetical protein
MLELLVMIKKYGTGVTLHGSMTFLMIYVGMGKFVEALGGFRVI